MNDRIDDLVAAHREDIHPAPPHVKQQWHDAIDGAAALERGKTRQATPSWHPASVFLGMAIAATLALGIGIGYFVADDGPASGNADALSRGLQVHFRDAREQIIELADADDRSSLILRIVAQNRLFEAAASNGDAPQLARLLRAFEPILLELADDDITPARAEALRAQLTFELNVVLTKLAAESSDDSLTT